LKIDVLEVAIKDVSLGEDVKVIKPVNLYGCNLGDRVFIGPFVEIQSDVRVGDDTRIQSHSFICSGVSIGRECFIGHGVMFINDTFSSGGPARGDKSRWRKTEIGSRVSIGSNATLLAVSICDGAVIGAGSVVTKDITEVGIYAGNPATLIRRIS